MKGVLEPGFRRRLLAKIKKQFRLDLRGIHGLPHWARVRENGLRIAASTIGTDHRVVELFAMLHDSQRTTDGDDPQHGMRAAHYASTIRDELAVSDEQFNLLRAACFLHSEGRKSSDPTVAACWDADRLDLGRIGVKPDPTYLSTPQAIALLPWAYGRSTRNITLQGLRLRA